LPFRYSGDGVTTQGSVSDPSSPSITAAPAIAYRTADGDRENVADGETVRTSSDTDITISTETDNAVIYYTTDGSTPDPRAEATKQFDPTAPISLRITDPTVTNSAISREIRAIAIGPNMKPSLETTATVTVQYPQAAAPTFDPPGGSYQTDQHVTLSTSTEGATIYYTLEPSSSEPSRPEPGQAGTQAYSGPILLSGPAATYTIAAVAAVNQQLDSTTATAQYAIDYAGLDPPTFNPPGGTYEDVQTVTISSDPSSTIWYTTNGDDPVVGNSNQIPAGGAVTVDRNMTIKALADADQSDPSAIVTQTFTLRPAAPTVTPSSSTYTSPQTITMSTSSPAEIYYVRSDSGPPANDPTMSDTKYDPGNPPTVGYGESAYFKVAALRDGWAPSAVVSREIHVRPQAPQSFALDLAAPNTEEFNGTRYSGPRPTFTWTPGAGTADEGTGVYRLRIGGTEKSVDAGTTSYRWEEDVDLGPQTVYMSARGSNGVWSPEVSTDVFVALLVGELVDLIFQLDGTSLREAMEAADSGPGKDAILFDESLSGTMELNGTLPIVTTDMTIIGDPGDPSRITIDGRGSHRLLEIYDGTLEIGGLTMKNGLAEGQPGNSPGGTNRSGGGGSAGMGGAMFIYGGSQSDFGGALAPEVTVDSVVFADNIARGGSGGAAATLDANGSPYAGGQGGSLPGGGGFDGGYGGAPSANAQAAPGSDGEFGSGGGAGGSADDPYEPGYGGDGGFGGGGGGAGAQLGVTVGSKAGGSGGLFAGNGGNNHAVGSVSGDLLAGGGGGAGLGGAVFAFQASRVSISNSDFTGNSAEGGFGALGTPFQGNTAGEDGEGVGGAVFLYEVVDSDLQPSNTFSGNTATTPDQDVYEGP
jgi:hypothetical protein